MIATWVNLTTHRTVDLTVGLHTVIINWYFSIAFDKGVIKFL